MIAKPALVTIELCQDGVYRAILWDRLLRKLAKGAGVSTTAALANANAVLKRKGS